MTPIQIKNLLRSAVDCDDPMMAWPAVKEIVERDMYINVPTGGWTNAPREVLVQWGDKPCQGRCNNMIPQGSKAMWVKGTGVWHLGCWKQ